MDGLDSPPCHNSRRCLRSLVCRSRADGPHSRSRQPILGFSSPACHSNRESHSNRECRRRRRPGPLGCSNRRPCRGRGRRRRVSRAFPHPQAPLPHPLRQWVSRVFHRRRAFRRHEDSSRTPRVPGRRATRSRLLLRHHNHRRSPCRPRRDHNHRRVHHSLASRLSHRANGQPARRPRPRAARLAAWLFHRLRTLPSGRHRPWPRRPQNRRNRDSGLRSHQPRRAVRPPRQRANKRRLNVRRRLCRPVSLPHPRLRRRSRPRNPWRRLNVLVRSRIGRIGRMRNPRRCPHVLVLPRSRPRPRSLPLPPRPSRPPGPNPRLPTAWSGRFRKNCLRKSRPFRFATRRRSTPAAASSSNTRTA